MCPPEPNSPSTRRLARYTPDSRRWRYAFAGVSAVAAPILFYYTARLISSTWSGTLPSLLVLVGSVLTLAAAALLPTLLLAPDADVGENEPDREEGEIAELKRQYASGNVSKEEFERRLETLMETSADAVGRTPDPDGDREADRASVATESELD